MLGAALSMAFALAGPGLPALHSAAAEQDQQEAILERARRLDPPQAARQHKPAAPDSPADKRAAAWRADHLTCVSHSGRTAEQFQRECAAWAADQAAREAAAR